MRAIGVILAGGNSKRMKQLSNKRAIAAMPVAGSFRSIDFTLSNMTNSSGGISAESRAGSSYSTPPSLRNPVTGTGALRMLFIRISTG